MLTLAVGRVHVVQEKLLTHPRKKDCTMLLAQQQPLLFFLLLFFLLAFEGLAAVAAPAAGAAVEASGGFVMTKPGGRGSPGANHLPWEWSTASSAP